MSITLLADAFMGMAALGASVYCFVLSRRLKRFNQLESGMGGAIAVLSAQVDDMTTALNRAQSTAASSAQQLGALVDRAEKGAQRLEIMLASLHDLAEDEGEQRKGRTVRRRPRTTGLEAAE